MFRILPNRPRAKVWAEGPPGPLTFPCPAPPPSCRFLSSRESTQGPCFPIPTRHRRRGGMTQPLDQA